MKQIVHKISGIVLVLFVCVLWAVLEYLSIRDGLQGIGTAWVFFGIWTFGPIYLLYVVTDG